jgi:translation initiation factor 2D
MSNLVQPFLPTFTASETAQLQIKKTSWKTIKKFLKTFDKLSLLKTKDQPGNEVVVMDIDFDDALIQSFKPYALPKKDAAPTSSNGKAAEQPSDSTDSSVGQKLKLISLFKPKDKLSPIFAASKANPSNYYTSHDLRPIITAYIEGENLISSTNKRFVTLNPTLANAVFDGKAATDKEILARGVVPRDTLIDRFISICSPYHIIQRQTSSTPSTAIKDEKPRAGSPPKITITLETRSGNKTVTKISGVETYFIAPQPLADELRKVCAGSTSVERLVGSSPKNPIMEVMVQGPQRDTVLKALEKRGVDKRWVDVVDKVKKKK